MQRPRSVSVFAPAKVNLALHVTGQREDGYHLIDSLVAFADVGDDIFIQPGNTLSLTTEGPEAGGVPADMDNLVLRVAGVFDDLGGASLLLTKNLPVSSGIGGGSADAAAAVRGLLAYQGEEALPVDFSDASLKPFAGKLLALGADIPMCLLSAYARVQGIGEKVSPIGNLPTLPTVLVNPRHAVSTPAVFKALEKRDNPGLSDVRADFTSAEDFIAWLSEQRNDMEEAAVQLAPVIADTLSALASDRSCLLARMSGSGATCFGLYATDEAAVHAAKSLSESHADWWVRSTRLGTQTNKALPRLS